MFIIYKRVQSLKVDLFNCVVLSSKVKKVLNLLNDKKEVLFLTRILYRIDVVSCQGFVLSTK